MKGESNRTAQWAVVKVREGHHVVMLTKTARRGPRTWEMLSSHRYRETADAEARRREVSK